MTKDKLLPLLDYYEPHLVANALRAMTRTKISRLKRETKTHATYKAIDDEIARLEAIVKAIGVHFPDGAKYLP